MSKKHVVTRRSVGGGGGTAPVAVGTKREFAPRVFDPANAGGVEIDAETVNIGMGTPMEAGAAPVVADRVVSGGGAVVVESNTVLGGGRPAQRRQPMGRRTGAAWQGAGDDQPQNVLLGNTQMADASVQDGTVPREQLILPGATGGIGPMLPTGVGCICVETGGMPTSFRGAPAWMTWCIVCGGERDGIARPENAVRYGEALPEPVVSEVNVQRIVEQASGAASAAVAEQIGGYFGSEAFSNLIGSKVEEALAKR